MEKSNFDDLLERYLANRVTEEERLRLETWLEVMKTEDTRDMELSAADEERLFQNIIASRDTTADIKALNPYKRDSGKWIIRIASAVAILTMASIALWYALRSDTQKLILDDGSIVWLERDSHFGFANQPGERLVTLTGEALFEVAKDPARPFRIQYQDVTVEVVGTSFRLKTGDSVQLTVLTGRVHVSSLRDSIGVDVTPNEKIVYVPAGLVQRSVLLPEEKVEAIAHTEYALDFTNNSLQEVVTKLSEKFDVAITIENKEAGRCRLTIDLTDHSLTEALDMIAEVLPIEYKKEKDSFTISGSGCKP